MLNAPCPHLGAVSSHLQLPDLFPGGNFSRGSPSPTEGATLTCHGVFRGAQLLSQLLHVIRMHLFVQRAPKPFRLGLVQHGRDGVRHVDDTPGLGRHDKQKSISRFQDEMLQLLGQKDQD